jgi:hypothetical protein
MATKWQYLFKSAISAGPVPVFHAAFCGGLETALDEIPLAGI